LISLLVITVLLVLHTAAPQIQKTHHKTQHMQLAHQLQPSSEQQPLFSSYLRFAGDLVRFLSVSSSVKVSPSWPARSTATAGQCFRFFALFSRSHAPVEASTNAGLEISREAVLWCPAHAFPRRLSRRFAQNTAAERVHT
jgi:hypothetical protein